MHEPFDENSLLRNYALPGDRADDAAPVAVPSGDVRGLTKCARPPGAVQKVYVIIVQTAGWSEALSLIV